MTGKALQNQIDRGASNEAVGWISLETARRFCAWLSARGSTASPPRRYRLPTEDEWEYACRASNPDRFCFGGSADYVPFFAHCNGGESCGPVVAQRMPNAFGLFDMHGGLWEWCNSSFPPEYVADPAVTAEQRRNLYVLRGGAYYSPAVRCRSAQRNYGDANTPGMYWGFRIVMEAPDA
jgi:formylglycine-generating enzyme required for sulfatase activity